MRFSVNGHIFELSDRMLFLVEFPDGSQARRIVTGCPASLEDARTLASKLLLNYASQQDAYHLSNQAN